MVVFFNQQFDFRRDGRIYCTIPHANPWGVKRIINGGFIIRDHGPAYVRAIGKFSSFVIDSFVFDNRSIVLAVLEYSVGIAAVAVNYADLGGVGVPIAINQCDGGI